MKTKKTLVGRKAVFVYSWYGTPDSCPDYTAHKNQVVTILRKLTDKENDPENETMFLIQADDGWKGNAYRSELRVIRKGAALKPSKKLAQTVLRKARAKATKKVA